MPIFCSRVLSTCLEQCFSFATAGTPGEGVMAALVRGFNDILPCDTTTKRSAPPSAVLSSCSPRLTGLADHHGLHYCATLASSMHLYYLWRLGPY